MCIVWKSHNSLTTVSPQFETKAVIQPFVELLKIIVLKTLCLLSMHLTFRAFLEWISRSRTTGSKNITI